MEKTEVIKGNKFIAEFMGIKRGDLYLDMDVSIAHQFEMLISAKELDYHLSWDWLIPVINKIYSLNEYYKYIDTGGQSGSEININTRFISVTWESVIQFIEWYNKNKL